MAETPKPARLLTNDEVAGLLGISPRTLESWRVQFAQPVGPKFLRIGRAIRYRPEDVVAYLNRRTVETLDEHPGLAVAG